MSLHAFYVFRLARELDEILSGATLHDLYSTEKSHLLFQFQKKDGQSFNLSFRIEGTGFYLHSPEHIQQVHRKRLDQFKSLWNKKVYKILPHAGERSFHIDFGGSSLLFLCYGRHANVILIGNNENQIFRKKKGTKEQAFPKDLNTLSSNPWPNNEETLNSSSFMNDELRDLFGEAHEKGYSWETTQKACLEGSVYLNDTETGYELSPLSRDKNLSQYNSILDGLNAFTELSLWRHFFSQAKNGLLRQLNEEINSSTKRLKALKQQQTQLLSKNNYRHIGDLILSNLPQIQEGMSSIELEDYLDATMVIIPLKEKLSPQDNAQRYYRKAKNQHLQESRLKEEVDLLETRILEALEKLESVEKAEAMNELRGLLKEQKKDETSQVRLPYHSFTIQGYQVLVGKQAKDNDELTLKIAKKDDLWLHARDIPGSHVVIRKKGGKDYPDALIEAAAGLALWFSKRRTETLAPVIYTEKKYVRKRKGDPAGAVIVEKEKVVIVAPLGPDHFGNSN